MNCFSTIRSLTAILLFGIALSTLCAFAKSPEDAATGTLDGRLTDWHSIPLAQAQVVLQNLVTGTTVHGITGKNGSYHFARLSPGEYRLQAELPELGKGAVEGILVSAGHATRVQAALVMELPNPPGPIEADVHELDPVEPAVTTMMSGEDLSELPLNSRNWQAFAAITPAANPAPGSSSNNSGQIGVQPDRADRNDGPQGESLAFAAGSAYQTASSIDGISSTPAFHSENGQRSHDSGAAGESAVMELHARAADASADAAQALAGSIGLSTAHGSNGWHGQAFYLNRQSLWGAQNPFTQQIVQTAPASGAEIAQFTAESYTPPYTRQTLGLGVGSQLKRDKLFWFAAVDGLFDNDPAVATVRHPTDFFAQPQNEDLTMLAARLGPSALESEPACPASSLPAAAILEQAAACYSGWLNQMTGLLGPVPRSAKQWQGFARIDWQTTERQRINLEANLATVDAPAGALGRSSETYGSHSFGNSQANDTWQLAKLDSFLTANLLNSASALYRRHVQSETPQTPSAFETPLLANTWGQLPQIVADSKYGFILGKPARLSKSSYPDERATVAQDTLSWVRGANLIKVGGSFDHISDAVGALVNQTGTYSYSDVLNFISDAASFLQYGIKNVDNPTGTYHNCDATGRVYATGEGTLGGLGDLPCYAWYSQRIGPSNWHLSTNDFAAFVTEQWQPSRNLTLSAGVRMDAEQLPPPIATVENADVPQTEQLPPMHLNWGPRFGLAWSPWSARNSTVLRLGAGLYYGRIDNSVALAALTQTGSVNGDLNFFFKPTDPGAPPFPYVFSTQPQTTITPGAVFFGGNFRPQEVDQAVFSIEQQLPSHWLVSVSAMASLGRRLPISVDINIDPTQNPKTITYAVVDAIGAGPIKTPQITVPFYTSRFNSSYQQLDAIESRANSTYQAEMIKLVRNGGRGLSLHAHYLYAHATDWNPNESGQVAVNDVFDPTDFRLEYGTSNLDIRHSAAATVLYETPWKLHNWAGAVVDGWSIAAVGQYRSGLPFTMRTGGYIPAYYAIGVTGSTTLIEGIATGINGSGGDDRLYGIGRNTYRYPATWTADSRLAKRFHLPHDRELEVLAESFNLFNHQNVTLLETTGYTIERGATDGAPPTLNFLTGLTKAGLPSTIPEFGKPLDVNATNFYRPREIQLGLRARF